ncbi:hypothetical protein SEPCBS57363_000730 [Sporothrix epigloea]|uniref:Benzodiazapine receptor n=1 Tax=Sporothrix epigloea TaxID=1892477 RepID=A0ABP0D6B4_9PEZI
MTTLLYHLALPDAVFSNPAASILLPVALGTAVGYSTRPSLNDPDVVAIKQPPLRPPPFVFGPVWTVLYGLMGYAAYRAVGQTEAGLDVPRDTQIISASLYTLQLGLNLAWMPLFFGLKRPVEATIDSVALLGINSYLAALWLTNPSTKVAGWCMVPYVAWLSFATYLCAGAGYLNGWSFKSKTKKRQ